jgi:hypothetical protein
VDSGVRSNKDGATIAEIVKCNVPHFQAIQAYTPIAAAVSTNPKIEITPSSAERPLLHHAHVGRCSVCSGAASLDGVSSMTVDLRAMGALTVGSLAVGSLGFASCFGSAPWVMASRGEDTWSAAGSEVDPAAGVGGSTFWNLLIAWCIGEG